MGESETFSLPTAASPPGKGNAKNATGLCHGPAHVQNHPGQRSEAEGERSP